MSFELSTLALKDHLALGALKGGNFGRLRHDFLAF